MDKIRSLWPVKIINCRKVPLQHDFLGQSNAEIILHFLVQFRLSQLELPGDFTIFTIYSSVTLKAIARKRSKRHTIAICRTRIIEKLSYLLEFQLSIY
jgi:hypothetical protein